MKDWFRQRSLRFRLTAAYAGISAAALCGLGILCLWILQLRLKADIDDDLRADYETIEIGLRTDAAGSLEWSAITKRPGERQEREGPRFEVLSLSGIRLFTNGPLIQLKTEIPVIPYKTRLFSTQVEGIGAVRILEKTGKFGHQDYIIRVLEPESLQAVTELAGVLAIGLPLTILLACIGGYFVAGRTLAPMSQMAALARRITADSLSERLPVRNPYDEIGRLATIFNETLTRLEQSFISLRRFAADASHELRTPVAALRAIGETALQTHSDDPQHLTDTMSRMLEESGRLGNLIDALLVLARADGGKLLVALEPVDAVALANEARDLIGILADEKGQEIVVKASNSPIPPAIADRELLRLALLNLLDNAIRYSPAGSPITLSVEAAGTSVAIDVIDRGPGISANHQDRVFERFYRVDEARSRATGGSGLGLAIARSVLQSQHGSLRLTSQEGEGSTFHIELPAAGGDGK